MNKLRQVPRAFQHPRSISNGFPEAYPIFWGPNQRILEDNEYIQPSGFFDNRVLVTPKIVRFIHDAHQEVVDAEECEFGGPVHVDAFARPATPAYGERPWALTGTWGSWWPDATAFLASTVSVVKRPDPDPGWGATEPWNGVDSAMTVEQALDEGILELYSFYTEMYWYRDGLLVYTAMLTEEEPIIVWSSDRPHLLTNVPCESYPTGCPCGGPI